VRPCRDGASVDRDVRVLVHSAGRFPLLLQRMHATQQPSQTAKASGCIPVYVRSGSLVRALVPGGTGQQSETPGTCVESWRDRPLRYAHAVWAVAQVAITDIPITVSAHVLFEDCCCCELCLPNGKNAGFAGIVSWAHVRAPATWSVHT
jgi:hypothetical protein